MIEFRKWVYPDYRQQFGKTLDLTSSTCSLNKLPLPWVRSEVWLAVSCRKTGEFPQHIKFIVGIWSAVWCETWLPNRHSALLSSLPPDQLKLPPSWQSTLRGKQSPSKLLASCCRVFPGWLRAVPSSSSPAHGHQSDSCSCSLHWLPH